jgi:Family of unknown function (DUF5335)
MQTKTRKLPREQWRAYFDKLSKNMGTTKVSVLIEGLDIGVQEEADKLLLEGMTYDVADDAFELAMAGTIHRIIKPREIYVQESVSGKLVSCRLTDDDGHDQIFQLEPAGVLPVAS